MGAADAARDVATGWPSRRPDLARTAREAAIHDVGTKSSETDVVTAADLAVEQLVRERLAPSCGPASRCSARRPAARATPGDGVCWVVDPIDGTVNYLYGFPWYAVSLAAQVDGVSVAAAVVEPASGRRWTATRGGGALLDGRPLRVSAATRLDLSLVAHGLRLPRRAPRAAGGRGRRGC